MKRTRPWLLLATVALVLGALVVAGCGDDDDEEEAGQPAGEVEKFPADTTMGKIQERGEIRIGVKFDVPPFGFKNPQSNQVEGFDADMGKFIAQELGVEPKFVEAISDNRIPFLKRGTVDLILSTMTINAERDQEIDFSEPYYIAEGRILVPKGSDIKGIDDLAGRNVCTALGSTYEETLRERAPKAKLKLVDTYSECLELLQNEAVDAVSTDDVILTGMIIQDDNLVMVGERLTTEPYGAGLKQGDSEWQRFVNDVMKQVEDDGRWEEAYQKWVGRHVGREEKPPTMTLQQALQLGS
jgi:ABC-type amino acid transport substrate-binding protein